MDAGKKISGIHSDGERCDLVVHDALDSLECHRIRTNFQFLRRQWNPGAQNFPKAMLLMENFLVRFL